MNQQFKFTDLPDGKTCQTVVVVNELGITQNLPINNTGQIRTVLGGIVDNQNSFYGTLNTNRTGVFVDTLDFNIICINVSTNKISATDGLQVQTTDDLINTYISDEYTIEPFVDKTFTIQPTRRYFRVNFLISEPDTTVDLSVILKYGNIKHSSHRIDDAISSQDDATLQKAVLTGQSPSGIFTNVKVNTQGDLRVDMITQKDAFGRLKVSDPYTIFDNSLTNEYSFNLYWSVLNNNSTSIYQRQFSCIDLIVGPDIGNFRIHQTKQRFKYQPAKSHEFFISTIVGVDNLSNAKRIVGLIEFDNINGDPITGEPQNGVFLEYENGTVYFVIANNGIITQKVSQPQWNLDKCDGNGLSGYNLDISKAIILTGQLEWLGVGVVLIGFVKPDGEILYAHAFMNVGMAEYVYMRTANLPISFAIYNTTGANAEGEKLRQICTSVISGGGYNPKALYRSLTNEIGNAIASGTIETLIGIRLKPNYFEYSVEIDKMSSILTSSGDGILYLIFNPVLAATPTWTDIDNSVLQVTYEGIIINSYDLIIASDFVSKNNNTSVSQIFSTLKIGKGIDGQLDTIFLAFKSFANNTIYGSLTVKEFL